ncbi:MAG: hypothetical protein AAF804_09520 [Bacteroidota bacterium]
MESSPIYIANPLYDVVFRYLMEDNKVAKLFLSAILSKEVVELRFSPTEFSKRIGGEDGGITVIRMDFHATVKEQDGSSRGVLIELQKAKLYSQIPRFRSYLGKQYQNPEHVDADKQALPLFPIYILGEAFTQEIVPVLRVSRTLSDATTNVSLHVRYPFVEALTHDAVIIQAKYLKGHRRTVLEKFLSIFDQSGKYDTRGHILALSEDEYPEQYRAVIRRLQKALQNPTLAEEMEIEDEIMDVLNEKDARIAHALKEAQDARQYAEAETLRAEDAKQRAEDAKQKAAEEKQRAEDAKQQAEEEKQRAEDAKQQAAETENALRKTIRGLAKSMSVADIAELVGLSQALIERILAEEEDG